MRKTFVKRGPPRKLIDRLTKERTLPDGSTIWKGTAGTYVFALPKETGPKKPIRRVMLNRVYLTGLFASKRPNEFLGDTRGTGGNCRLVFRSVRGGIEVYEKPLPQVQLEGGVKGTPVCTKKP